MRRVVGSLCAMIAAGFADVFRSPMRIGETIEYGEVSSWRSVKRHHDNRPKKSNRLHISRRTKRRHRRAGK